MILIQDELKKYLHYNPDTGIFKWNVKRNGVKKDVAGCVCKQSGYRIIGLFGKTYRASRLAWLYMYGYLPENVVDHINQDRIDDRIKNLREVSYQCNTRNSGNQKNSSSGVKGVYWNERYQQWEVQIKVEYKSKYICRCEDFLEAVCHRLAAEQCLDWANCDSNSPAYKYVKENLKC